MGMGGSSPQINEQVRVYTCRKRVVTHALEKLSLRVTSEILEILNLIGRNGVVVASPQKHKCS
jgi:hypothetical protein